ncbi:hypothetical protein K439DRAFT_1642930 [Ramaria rubella]|nr:hypothetical protein K439DRAFT_1642930 [Ramaria rubella]
MTVGLECCGLQSVASSLHPQPDLACSLLPLASILASASASSSRSLAAARRADQTTQSDSSLDAGRGRLVLTLVLALDSHLDLGLDLDLDLDFGCGSGCRYVWVRHALLCFPSLPFDAPSLVPAVLTSLASLRARAAVGLASAISELGFWRLGWGCRETEARGVRDREGEEAKVEGPYEWGYGSGFFLGFGSWWAAASMGRCRGVRACVRFGSHAQYE